MDTTKKYILMSEKAEEIQANWQKENGDYILVHPTDSLPCPELRYPSKLWSDVFIYQKKEARNYDKVIYLPRQDQLQEMLDKWYKNNPHVLISDFYDSIYEEPMPSYYVPKNFTSMEQLWLAFVMKENYNKIWDGKEWVNRIRINKVNRDVRTN